MLEGRLTANVGETVEFTYDVTNADDEPVTLLFRDGGRADVAVLDDGEEVWRWSDGRLFTQVVSETTLQPGETATVEMTWEDPEPGHYTARAALRTEAECAATTAVVVE